MDDYFTDDESINQETRTGQDEWFTREEVELICSSYVEKSEREQRERFLAYCLSILFIVVIFFISVSQIFQNLKVKVEWDQLVQYSVFSYNTSFHRTTRNAFLCSIKIFLKSCF